MDELTLGFRRDAQGRCLMGGMLVADIVEQANVTTPVYIYDLGEVVETASRMARALGDTRGFIAYAVKANAAGSLLRALAEVGTGADVVSGAELELALLSGVPRDRIVMSGVAKTDAELDLAIARDILAIQVESLEELHRLAQRSRELGVRARVSLRIKPGVDADTHAHVATGHDTAKFGIALSDVPAAFETIDRNAALLQMVGVSTHVGSMLASEAPYLEGARVVCDVAKERQSQAGPLRFCDFGGGFGIDYGGRPCPPVERYIGAARATLKEYGLDLDLIVEPGRSMVGPSGILVAKVLSTKSSGDHSLLLIDAGMNDLIRPALYGARHRVEPLSEAPGERLWRVVGPVCESADDFGAHALGVDPPGYVVIRDAGAYGFSMASEYNGRSLPSEVFVNHRRLISVSRAAEQSSWVERRQRA